MNEYGAWLGRRPTTEAALAAWHAEGVDRGWVDDDNSMVNGEAPETVWNGIPEPLRDDERGPSSVVVLTTRGGEVQPQAAFPEPEDRGLAVLSPLGDVEYVEDLIRPGRIVVVAAEEGAGKSYTIGGELCIRCAVAGGDFAGTWRVVRTGPVLYLSEMHPDDDFEREDVLLDTLGLSRQALVGRYYRLPLMTAAGDRPALTVPAWRDYIIEWCRAHGVTLLVIDTATGATQVDPWGKAIQAVYRDLRAMLEAYPDLAIVLLLHLKKPQGRGARRLSDVLGEWGRWNDVTLLMEAEGDERTKLSTHKRVRRPRRVTATKRGGLLVEPHDIVGSGPKVGPEAVLAVIVAQPGITIVDLAAAIGVSERTADGYARDLVKKGKATRQKGLKGRWEHYPVVAGPEDAGRRSQVVATDTLRADLRGEGAGRSQVATHPIGVRASDLRPAPTPLDADDDRAADPGLATDDDVPPPGWPDLVADPEEDLT